MKEGPRRVRVAGEALVELLQRSKGAIYVLAASLLTVVAAFASSGQRPSHDQLWEMRREAADGSRAMSYATTIVDVFGSRLTGSPSLRRAEDWIEQQLDLIGLASIKRDEWVFGKPGWVSTRATCRVLTPIPEPLHCVPSAWTPPTEIPIVAFLSRPRIPASFDGDPELAWREFGASLPAGAAVMVEPLSDVGISFEPPSPRLSESQVARFRWSSLQDVRPGIIGTTVFGSTVLSPRVLGTQSSKPIDELLLDAGVAFRLVDSGLDHGLIRAHSNPSFDIKRSVPTLVIRNEDYSRLWRMLDRGVRVSAEVLTESSTIAAGEIEYNILGELRGSEFPTEVVIVGAHLDSWHISPSATDNAAGVAIVLEAARLLANLEHRDLRRTIRFAFWTGEEQGLLGSRSYIRRWQESEARRGESIAAYLNLDGGGGRIRGASVYSDSGGIAAVLDTCLRKFQDLGSEGAVAEGRTAPEDSDYASFTEAGVPSVRFHQDPLYFTSHTWHTDIDHLERLSPRDLEAAAVVLAASAYSLATQNLD